jgi:ferredoxin
MKPVFLARDAWVPAAAILLILAGCGGGSGDGDDGDDGVTDPLHPLTEYDPRWGTIGTFAAATECAVCHRASVDTDPDVPAVLRYPLEDDGEDVSPPTQWQHSMMSQSLSDPYFLATLEEETHLFPELAGLIEDICLKCHAPMGRTHAYHTGSDLDADGYYRLDTALESDISREGGSCTSCHQIVDDGGLGTTTFSGDYTISATDRMIYGQYLDPPLQPMRRSLDYTAAFGAHMAGSGHCATCHVLFTPTLDADTGAPTGRQFLEQGVYFEWQNSVYVTGREQAAECQDCHMPDPDPGSYATRLAVRTDGSVNVSWPERGPEPPFHEHRMLGTNAHMMAILRDFRDVLGLESSTTPAGFDEQISQTRAFLETAAELEVADARLDDSTLAVDVTVRNRSGHKLPTSFPSRRVWLNLLVSDSTGAQVFDSGTPDSNGLISGDLAALGNGCLDTSKPADFDNTPCFQPHRDVITDDSQVAIYEPVLADTNSNTTYVLLKASHLLKDNRLPPEGFGVTPPPENIRPVGIAGDADFNIDASGEDTVHYRIDTRGYQPPFSIRARLLYQAVRPAFAQSLKAEGDHIERFHAMLEDHPPAVEQIAELAVDVP